MQNSIVWYNTPLYPDKKKNLPILIKKAEDEQHVQKLCSYTVRKHCFSYVTK